MARAVERYQSVSAGSAVQIRPRQQDRNKVIYVLDL